MLLWVLDAERPSYAAAVCALPSTAPLSVSHNLLCWRNSSPIIYRLINTIQQHPSAQQTRETAQKWEPNKTITHGKQTGNYNNQIRLQELFQLPRHFIRHGITKENRPELSHLTLLGKLPLVSPSPTPIYSYCLLEVRKCNLCLEREWAAFGATGLGLEEFLHSSFSFIGILYNLWHFSHFQDQAFYS